MKICAKGVWDETVPGIEFDQKGVSNYYYLMQKLMDAYPRGDIGKERWLEIVKMIRGSSNGKTYDCIIGVSGGTDSCFLLHIAKKYGLRPLAVNFDNGWSSDIAVKNIRKITNTLNIDLETYVVNYEEIKDLNVAYMKAGLPWIDLPTDLAIKSILYKIAAEVGVKFVLRGNDFRSEGSQPREWTYGDGRQLKYIHKLFGKVGLKSFPNYTKVSLVKYSLFKGIKSIYPFYYLDYHKKDAQEFLMKNYGWEYYGGHHYENHFTRFAISYWLYEKFNIDKRIITLSAQVISGEISREQALQELKRKPYNDQEKERFLNFVLKKLDLSNNQFNELFKQTPRTFRDYPSDYSYIERLNTVYKPLLNHLFLHKPQSLFQVENRKKVSGFS